MDRVGAEFHRTVDMIRDRLGAVPAVVQLPWGVESNFHGVIDLVEMTGHYWPSEGMGEHTEPFSALAFKVMSDPYVGKLTYFRVYSGTLKAGSRVQNATKDRT